MITLYNTLTRQAAPFTPIEPGVATIYSCGPTVYRFIHIGNLRTFLMADWLRRTLDASGINVRHVKNITDVGHMRVEMLDQGEDKMVSQARQEGKSSADLASFYTAAFRDDETRMNILPANVFPRATEHIPEMIEIINGLVQKNHAYAVGGNVFFDIRSFPNYGRLSGNRLAQLLEGARDTDDTARRNPEDFPLWKVAEPGREMAWDSPWGRGFPGWHIECSAMAMKYLGPHFDIHTGGVDNIFPHHEGELAQSECYTDETFVNVWMHAQHLLADGLKMAKSTGNAYTLSDIEARGFEPMALRYLFATVHYRSRINFTFSALRAAQTSLRRLRLATLRLREQAGDAVSLSAEELAANEWHQRISAVIADDLNIPQALAHIWRMVRGSDVRPTMQLAIVHDIDAILGLRLAEWLVEQEQPHPMPELDTTVTNLIARRDVLRQAGNFVEADRLRIQIRAAGWNVRDTRRGPMVEQRAVEEEFTTITRSQDVPDYRAAPDQCSFSVQLLARDSRADVQRCIESVVRHSLGHDLELVIVDNGSTDDTVPYLQMLVRNGLHTADGTPIPLTVLFADHNLGFAAGRNATLRASRGRIVVLVDTSIELAGDIWTPIAHVLADETVGYVGPYGLVTADLKEFRASEGPRVDAVEGYLIAFRRELLPEIGLFDEKFRFYRLLDIHHSFYVKTAGYDVIADGTLATQIIKHPHREWYSLSAEEQATRSKKNFDIFRRRWHHGQSMLTMNYAPENRWFGHDHASHLKPAHTHAPDELPPPDQMHSHSHRHWPDHDHDHPHVHSRQDS